MLTPAATALPRGWHKPVRPGALLLVSAVVVLTWLAGTTAAVLYFYQTWEARFTLRDQPLKLRLPAGMQAVAEVTSPIRTRIDVSPPLSLMIDQPVRVELPDSLIAHARLNASLPVDTTVRIDTMVPVRTTVELLVSLRAWLPRLPVSVPVTVNLPVRMDVPLKTVVPIAFDIDVSGALPHTLTVPVRAALKLRPRVRGDVNVHLNATTLFSLRQPPDPFDVRIHRADIRVPFNLTFGQR